MPIGVTHFHARAVGVDPTWLFTQAEFADSGAHTIDVASTIRWLDTDPTYEVAGLSTWAITALAWVSTISADAHPTFEAIALDRTGVGFGTAPINTGTITGTF